MVGVRIKREHSLLYLHVEISLCLKVVRSQETPLNSERKSCTCRSARIASTVEQTRCRIHQDRL